MATAPSIVKKKTFIANQQPIVADIMKHYKSIGYKIQDGNETVMILEPGTTFRIFISRISHNLQFYFLGEWQYAQNYIVKDLDSVSQVIDLERQFKGIFG